MFDLKLSHSDVAYLVTLIGGDIQRLKGTHERNLLTPAYRLWDKLKTIQGNGLGVSPMKGKHER